MNSESAATYVRGLFEKLKAKPQKKGTTQSPEELSLAQNMASSYFDGLMLKVSKSLKENEVKDRLSHSVLEIMKKSKEQKNISDSVPQPG